MKKLLTALAAVALTAPLYWHLAPSHAEPTPSPTPEQLNRIATVATVADVVTAANAFLATLSTSQQATVMQAYTQTNVKKWSNLPCGATCRVGIKLSTLSAAQLVAAKAVLQAAAGTTANEGYSEIMQIMAADDVLAASGGGSGYSSGTYFLAFLGTPSTTGTWQLQFGGHHLAVNTTYEAGGVAGATPVFEGIEPKSWTTAGTTYAPLASEQAAMAAMLASLSTTELASAHLNTTFSDVLLGPNQDGNFPAVKQGLAVSSLTAAQQALVLAAMEPWVRDADDPTAASLLATYQTELDRTYIAYSGNAALSSNADYVRIDGPSVWIEFVCQNGIVFPSQIHYHSIWRDHYRDYGGNFYVTGVKEDAAAAVFSLYPNPVGPGQGLMIQLAGSAAAATTAASYTLRNGLGQTVSTRTFVGATTDVPTVGLSAGVYLLSVQLAGHQPAVRRIVVQ